MKIAFYLPKGIPDTTIAAERADVIAIGKEEYFPKFRALNPGKQLLWYRDIRAIRATDSNYPIAQKWIVTVDNVKVFDLKYPSNFLADVTNVSYRTHVADFLCSEVKRIDAACGIDCGLYLDEAQCSISISGRYNMPLPAKLISGWRKGLTETVRLIRYAVPVGFIVANAADPAKSLPAARYVTAMHNEAVMGELFMTSPDVPAT